jgi:hypothetical protein
MSWFGRSLGQPASEGLRRFVVGVCIVAMSVMCIVLIWQAQIIANQRDMIRWLETAKLHG